MKKQFLVVILCVIVLSLVAVSCGTKKQVTPVKKELTPLEIGREKFDSGDYDTAAAKFNAVLAADTTNHEAAYYLGRIALQQGNIDACVDHFENAVKLDETNSQYHLMLGVGLAQKVQKGEIQLVGKLKEEFEKAVELDGTNLDARTGLAQFYLNAPPFAGGSAEKANEQIAAITEQDPVRGNLFQAQIHAAKKQYGDAETYFQAAVDADPDDPDIIYQWGMMHQAAENYPPAFDKFEAALAIDPKHMNSLYQFGRTAIFAGDKLERGAETLTIYLKNKPGPGNPSLAHAHWRLGLIYEKMGEPDLAKKEYQAALELNPDLKEAKEALEKL